MKVICVNYGHKIPNDNPHYVKEGRIYTVKKEVTGYSDYAGRIVDAYEFEELPGYFERGMFIPLSDFDEKLIQLLRTKPINKNRDEKN